MIYITTSADLPPAWDYAGPYIFETADDASYNHLRVHLSRHERFDGCKPGDCLVLDVPNAKFYVKFDPLKKVWMFNQVEVDVKVSTTFGGVTRYVDPIDFKLTTST